MNRIVPVPAVVACALLFAAGCGSDAAGPEPPCLFRFRESFYSVGLIAPGGSTQIGTVAISTYEVREGPSLEESVLTRATVRWQVIMAQAPNQAIVHIHDAGGSETPHLYAGSGLASFSGPFPYVPYVGAMPFDQLFAAMQAQTAVFDVHGQSATPVARGIIAKTIEPLTGAICD